jgi:hypothetical protein
MNFNFTFLGQSILRYETPLDIFHAINQTYEQKFNQLEPANKQLVGKIKDEHSLFYDGEDESKMKRHNMLPKNVLDWFMSMFHHYLEFNHIRNYQTHLNSIWVNEMKAHEYNPCARTSRQFVYRSIFSYDFKITKYLWCRIFCIRSTTKW